jgi:CheY-like chemotaxis protein
MMEQSPRLRRLRILIVDDNRDSAESLQTILELEGHQAVASFSGLEALEIAEHLSPELVILDIAMPGMDGFETARKLRALAGSRDLKLIALSGWGSAANDARITAAGFSLHLVKPVDFAQLNAIVAQFASVQ